MSDLKAAFEQASQDAVSLSKEPDNMTKLQMYALYKQSTKGDADGKRPGMMNPVGRAKWDAWNEKKGMSNDDAMQAYIDLVESLKG